MKKIFPLLLLFVASQLPAQQFVSTGTIEYEVRTNNYKVFGDGIWADIIKDKVPQFSTTYYSYTFDGDKGLYKFDRYDEKSKVPMFINNNIDDNTWYSDYSAKTFTDMKWVFDNNYLMTGTLMNIDWKLSPNETRVIAGFNCRKATGIIFDSVYVFAFYTDEITTPGGPMGIHGLPGMILGVTIPRMFTSWIATKLQVTGVDPKKIVPPTKGKKKDALELKETVQKATKDWGTWGTQAVWQIFL
ncbi:MAG: GLPGLI family protein [Chitinophagaceae bacterium]